MSDNHHEEDHSGPIKTPKQVLVVSILAFVVPVFLSIGLATYVASDAKPNAGATNMEKSVSERLQKVGSIEVRDANRPAKAGADVYKAQCAACHDSGAAGAPKLGDAGAWGARIKNGYEALLTSALKGKGAMAPQGGGDHSDLEIGRAVVHLANASGAKFEEPKAPAAAPAEQAAK